MLDHKGTKTIKTDRLILRRYRAEDAEDMHSNWACDGSVCEYMSWRPHQSLEDTRDKINKWIAEYDDPKVYHWVIEFGAQAIGDIAVREFSEKNMWCEVGYCVGRHFWGRGIASEALFAVMEFLFEQVGFNRVGAWHEAENTASGRVMTKCGMIFEGTAKGKDLRYDGKFCDMKMYGLVKERFLNNKHKPNRVEMYV